jgi:cell division protease FtsH
MFTKPYSEDTAKVIDEEVSKMIEYQYARAIQILTENKGKLEQLANKLLTAEVIFKEDLESIFGRRIWDKEDVLPEATETKEIIPESDVTPSDTNAESEDITQADTDIDSDLEKGSKDENPTSESKE